MEPAHSFHQLLRIALDGHIDRANTAIAISAYTRPARVPQRNSRTASSMATMLRTGVPYWML